MQVGPKRAQSGFTLIELMITVAIVGILAAIALGQYRDYVRRAKMSEVILATSACKTAISEGYLSMATAPAAGSWGCENSATTPYVAAVKTSSNGAIRITINNLDPQVDGQSIHLVPVKLDGTTPLSSTTNLGDAVPQWLCGSDSLLVRNALPSNCRSDTTTYASGTFE